jgi:hypothetical protein
LVCDIIVSKFNIMKLLNRRIFYMILDGSIITISSIIIGTLSYFEEFNKYKNKAIQEEYMNRRFQNLRNRLIEVNSDGITYDDK